MTPLPLTVVSGYLGAGKTTLINGLLAEPHGLRLMVMVNDFGAINIDADLIEARDEDVIALTNGCVCCTMGADLFMAIGDALDRRPRPDHLIIEASGIADPKAIANTALAEPDLRYAGIVTLVDALNIERLLDDALVSPQVLRQIAVADLVVQTKTSAPVAEVSERLDALGLHQPVVLGPSSIAILTLDTARRDAEAETAAHPEYASWHFQTDTTMDAAKVLRALEQKPSGLYRLKGLLDTDEGGLSVHAVGSHLEVKPAEMTGESRLVGLGPTRRLNVSEVNDWWADLTDNCRLGYDA